MKMIIVFVVGLVFGILGTIAVNDPKGTSRQAHRLIDKATGKVEEVSYERCRKDFLDRTSCFQNKEKKAEDCIDEIEELCGKNK